MVDWEITATTVFCNSIDDEVTIMVYKDFSVKCTGFVKYARGNPDAVKLLKQKSKKAGRNVECTGLDCNCIAQYKNKLSAEEKK